MEHHQSVTVTWIARDGIRATVVFSASPTEPLSSLTSLKDAAMKSVRKWLEHEPAKVTDTVEFFSTLKITSV